MRTQSLTNAKLPVPAYFRCRKMKRSGSVDSSRVTGNLERLNNNPIALEANEYDDMSAYCSANGIVKNKAASMTFCSTFDYTYNVYNNCLEILVGKTASFTHWETDDLIGKEPHVSIEEFVSELAKRVPCIRTDVYIEN